MKNVHDIEIEIKGKEWEQILDAAFQKRVKNTSIDGFRKGKCPKDVYLKKFGIESLFMDAIDEACGKAYMDLLSKEELAPVCEPKMDIHSTPHLWITLVENPVENVENYELSTGIPIQSLSTPACGIFAYRFA